ncbi:hypothetical protein NEIRO03_0075 [Nematocida sp. AWRm78]|nr:hypothetical protein NEIRO02_0110 [Nematocida sp. AWRm79]KAI5182391.1 hypothetical protein NEIRO03_0075 [Nematocida sp. AWRm78]
MTFVDSLSRVYEGTSYESDAPSLMACVMAVMNEIDQQILDIHIKLKHRKAILKDLAKRNIKVTATQLKNVLDTCRECLERDNQFMRHNRYIDTTEPGELMGVDLMEYQNRYVFVMIDYFSRMAFGVDLLKKDANRARSCIERVFKAVDFYCMGGTMSKVGALRPLPRSLIELYNWKLKLYKMRIIKNFNRFTYCTRE